MDARCAGCAGCGDDGGWDMMIRYATDGKGYYPTNWTKKFALQEGGIGVWEGE